MAERRILGGDASGAKVAVVGMRTESNDAHRLILCPPRPRKRSERQCNHNAREPRSATNIVCRRHLLKRIQHAYLHREELYIEDIRMASIYRSRLDMPRLLCVSANPFADFRFRDISATLRRALCSLS